MIHLSLKRLLAFGGRDEDPGAQLAILRNGVTDLAKPDRVALGCVNAEILLALFLLVVEVLEFEYVTFALVLALHLAELEPVKAHDFGD